MFLGYKTLELSGTECREQVSVVGIFCQHAYGTNGPDGGEIRVHPFVS